MVNEESPAEFLWEVVSGINWDKDHISYEDDGHGGTESSFKEHPCSGTCCTGYAVVLFIMLKDNPKADTIDMLGIDYGDFRKECSAGGHDLLLVNDRFLIEVWAKEMGVANTIPAVVDTENPSELELFEDVFGPLDNFKKWIPDWGMDKDFKEKASTKD